MQVYNDKTSVALTPELKTDALKKLNELYNLLGFLHQQIDDETLDKNVINTSMGLHEAYYRDLAKMLDYDTILEEEAVKRLAEVKQKNIKIQELTNQLGKEISPQAVVGAIQLYIDIFRAWYDNEGFQYASITVTPYGLNIELTDQMVYNQDDTIENQRHELEKLIWQPNKHTIQKKESGWDIDMDKYHASLLDSDNNKKKIAALILSDFPGAIFHKFESRRNDNQLFALRTECFIPFGDISIYYKKRLAQKEGELN